jgi:hypothetical protein
MRAYAGVNDNPPEDLMRRFTFPSAIFLAAAIATATATALAPLAVAEPAGAVTTRHPARGTWGAMEEVPGTAALNTSGNAGVNVVSCASPGNCAAGGYYSTVSGAHAFLASQRDGRWATAFSVAGSIMKKTRTSDLNAVSCPQVGDCAAAGVYADSQGHDQAFVVSQREGRWGQAQEVPGSGSLNAGGNGGVSNLVCVSAGNCVAAGYYEDSSHKDHIYTAEERNRTWRHAYQVPGLTALGVGAFIIVTSLSCPSIGGCVLGGQYEDSHGQDQAFLATEKNGKWQAAQEVPGTAALNVGGIAALSSVSCPSPGNCGASGSYQDQADHTELFVISERNGRWAIATEMPGIARLNAGNNAAVGVQSCPSAGNCVIGGLYSDSHQSRQAFIVTEKDGHWANAEKVPGLARLNADGASIFAVSCASASNCGIGGSYGAAHDTVQDFVDNEVNGRWGQPIEIPGSAALNKGGVATISSMSCRSAVACTAGGSYFDRKGRPQAMVVSQTS